MATKKVTKLIPKSEQTDQSGAVNILSAAQLFSAGTPIAVRTEIPEVGGAILVKAMSARDILSFIGSKKSESPEEQQAAIIALIQKTVVNPDGSPMFPSEDDVEKLKNLRFPVFTAIAQAVTEAAGLGKKDKVSEELGKV